MAYVDGYVTPVPRAKLEAYRALAELAATVWREHGALEYREWVADDVKPGKLTSFPQAVMLKDDEVVVFAYIVFESRESRDEVNAKVMADARFEGVADDGMFDHTRMFVGGFAPFVSR